MKLAVRVLNEAGSTSRQVLFVVSDEYLRFIRLETEGVYTRHDLAEGCAVEADGFEGLDRCAVR